MYLLTYHNTKIQVCHLGVRILKSSKENSHNGNDIAFTTDSGFKAVLNQEYSFNHCAKTKIMIPKPPEQLVAREQLLSKLDEIYRKKLTVLSAPAGFGKTTLISTWVSKESMNAHFSWVSLSEIDNNLRSFWYYIVLSLNLSFNNSIYEMLSKLDTEQNLVIEEILNALINELLRKGEQCVFVLDDYHLVNDRLIDKSMQYFLCNIPCNVHVVLITRTKPGLPMAKLRIEEALLEVKAEEIRFSRGEIYELFHHTIGVELSEGEIKKIESCTEGWVAALKIIALTMKRNHSYKDVIIESNYCNEHLLEYLSEEIIGRLPEYIKNFFYKTSLLPALNSSLCNFVLGIDNSQEILDMLIEINLFIVALDRNSSYYRYHPLFSEFLRCRLYKYCPHDVDGICLKASNWYEENGYFHEAIEFSIKSKDSNNTIRLIDLYVSKIAVRGEFQKIVSFIETLPTYILESKPRICIYYVVSLAILGKVDGEESYLKKRGIDLDSSCFDEFRGAVYGIRSMAALYRKEIHAEEVRRNAYRALEILMDDSLGFLMKAVAYSNLANISAMEGDLKKACEFFRTALELGNKSENLYVVLTVTHKIAQIYRLEGKLKDALELYKNMLHMLEQHKLIYPSANMIHLGISTIYFELNEVDSAYENIMQSIELSKIRNDSIKLLQCYVMLAKIRYVQNKHEAALKAIKTIEGMAYNAQLKFILKQYFSDVAKVLIKLGRVDILNKFIERFDIKQCCESDYVYENTNITMIELLIADGKYDEAWKLAEELLSNARAQQRLLSTIKLLAASVRIHWLQGSKSKAMGLLREAVRSAMGCGCIQTLIDLDEGIEELIIELHHKYKEYQVGTEERAYLATIIEKLQRPGAVTEEASLEDKGHPYFTPRENEIIKCIVDGFTGNEISEKLFISLSTVKKHTKNIYEKLNVNNRAKAIKAIKRLKMP